MHSRILKILTLTLLVAIIAVFLIQVVLKRQIGRAVKAEINTRLHAQKTDFAGLHISMFGHFPDPAISIDNLAVFNGSDTLFWAKELSFSIRLFSVFNNHDYRVNNLQITSPVLKITATNNDALTDIIHSCMVDTVSQFLLDITSWDINHANIAVETQPGIAVYIHDFNTSGNRILAGGINTTNWQVT